ncbi:uncharacterized protein [Henckelia pumila]|uniref:uncharacterized protein n=1 Tax=Henckelia pumila TaxID=405737 RepID=UPI003C6E9CC0
MHSVGGLLCPFTNLRSKPTYLCQKVDLCRKNASVSQYVSKDKCDLCHCVITEALEKLKDPDTELEIVKLLMKACGSTGKNINKCKSLVTQYTLVYAQRLLETKELCTILHACNLTPVTFTFK